MEVAFHDQLQTLHNDPDHLQSIGMIGKDISPETFQDISKTTAQVIARNRQSVPDLQQFADGNGNINAQDAQYFILNKITDHDNARLSQSIKNVYQSSPDDQTKQDIQRIQNQLHLAHSRPEDHETVQHGTVKLAKFTSNQIRTETTKTFLNTVADSMTSVLEGVNTGAKAKIDTNSMKLDADGNYIVTIQ